MGHRWVIGKRFDGAINKLLQVEYTGVIENRVHIVLSGDDVMSISVAKG